MSDLATFTTDVAEWLTAQPLHELPPIFGLNLTDWTVLGLTAELQLRTGGDEVATLTALERWADHLGTDVVVTDHTTTLKAQVIGQTRHGYRLPLWGHLGADVRRVLGAAGYRFGFEPVEVPAVALRDAAACLSGENDGATCPGCGH